MSPTILNVTTSRGNIDTCSKAAANFLGYASLKQEQATVINQFLFGKDVFAVLPTGFGKTLCYACLPLVFDAVLGTDRSIVVVISPLVSIMKDQVRQLHGRKCDNTF